MLSIGLGLSVHRWIAGISYRMVQQLESNSSLSSSGPGAFFFLHVLRTRDTSSSMKIGGLVSLFVTSVLGVGGILVVVLNRK